MNGTISGRDADDYRAMTLIRRTEEAILDLFSQNRLSGTTHTSIGQEANAVGVIGQLDTARDHVISNHRCHGHYLAFGRPLGGLLAEVMGKATGVCKGRGGSQHLRHGNFLSNGILGGGSPIACGIAMTEKLNKGDGIVVSCLGDGSLGEGVVYESLNLASLWSLPVLFLVEANGYAQSTPTEKSVAGSIFGRAAPFGIEGSEITSTDVGEIREWGARAIEYVRRNRKPYWAVVHTCRLAAHSKGDDTRGGEELARLAQLDPLKILRPRINDEQAAEAEAWAVETVAMVLEEALSATDAELEG